MTRNRRVRTFVKQHKRLGRWRYAVTVLTAVIVFCTVYALILPAITMERPSVCGYAEHTHTHACFDENGTLICGLIEHTHSDDCYPSDEENDSSPQRHDALTASPDEAPALTALKPAAITLPTSRRRELAAVGADETGVTLSKKIEHIGSDSDYNYRLHLAVDAKLKDEEVTPGGVEKGISGALIIDVTETMAGTWVGSGTDVYKGVQAFQALYDSNSFLGQFIAADDANEISVIGMRGADQGAYTDPLQTVVITEWTHGVPSGRQFHEYQMNGRQPNYIAALLRAQSQFGLADAANDKAIIFITGNAPSYYSNSDGTSPGRAGDYAHSGQKTKDFVDSFLESGISIYVVGMEQFGSGSNEVPKYMGDQSVAKTGKGGYFAVNNLEQMKDVLINTILPDIVIAGDKTTNLTFSDQLSGNVAYVGSPTATLTIGSTSADVSADIVWDSDTKTVSYSYPDEIEGSYKLEISFDIKTADGVYRDTDAYSATGYPNVGDAGTDWGTNASSSGQPGYYSNDTATVSYQLNGTDESGTFPHPVVQAPERPAVTKNINVTKHWSGTLVPQAITLTLYTESGGAYTVLDTLSLPAEQDASGSYTYTFPSGETEKTIWLVEGSAVDTLPMYSGTTAKINTGSSQVDAAQITLTADGSDASVTVTNWPKTRMPATGGMGTAPLITLGAALILLAGGVLIYRRKRGEA